MGSDIYCLGRHSIEIDNFSTSRINLMSLILHVYNCIAVGPVLLHPFITEPALITLKSYQYVIVCDLQFQLNHKTAVKQLTK